MIGGIRLEGKKEASITSWTIRHMPPPAKVHIALSQSPGASAIPCVREGMRVRVGQKIAEPSNALSTAAHASVSGQVASIHSFAHPLGGEAQTIEIHSDGRDEKMPDMGQERQGWENSSFDFFSRLFQDSGLIDLGNSAEPLHVKISKAAEAKIETVIINGCESEPYLTSDYALMMSHPIEILKGAEILRRVTGAENLVIAIEENKLEAAELLKSKIYFLKWQHASVLVLPALYPQDSELVLIHEVTGVERKKALAGAKLSTQVFNVATAFSVYEATVCQKPLYERAVTVGGECVVEPKNLWLRIGTSFEDSIKACRGLMREPRKVLMNGPMKGIAQSDLHAPVIKQTRAILALPQEVVAGGEIEPCIRCQQCLDSCPAGISPVMITLASEKNLFSLAKLWGADFCIECGNCAYVCPAKRPMMELIHHARFPSAYGGPLPAFEGNLPEGDFDPIENLRKKKRNSAETVVYVSD